MPLLMIQQILLLLEGPIVHWNFPATILVKDNRNDQLINALNFATSDLLKSRIADHEVRGGQSRKFRPRRRGTFEVVPCERPPEAN